MYLFKHEIEAHKIECEKNIIYPNVSGPVS